MADPKRTQLARAVIGLDRSVEIVEVDVSVRGTAYVKAYMRSGEDVEWTGTNQDWAAALLEAMQRAGLIK